MRRIVGIVPFVGIAAFAVLMALALAHFPGGNRFQPHASGFSFTDNYWCDLFDGVTHAGAPNGGRVYGVAATVVLPLSLIPFWAAVTSLFPNDLLLRRLVPLLGAVGMVFTALVPVALHDAMILTAGPVAFAAYVLTLVGLWRAGRRLLAASGTVPAALSVVSFTLWVSQLAIRVIPSVQKCAALTLLAWILVAHVRALGVKPRKA